MIDTVSRHNLIELKVSASSYLHLPIGLGGWFRTVGVVRRRDE